MTTRRRHSTHTSSSSHDRPDTDTPDPSRRSDGGGGNGTDVDVDAVDTMAGRLEATRSKVDGVKSTLDGVSLGTDSMGLVGQPFVGAAESHLKSASQVAERTGTAVQNAHQGTKQTAADYRGTDDANATTLNQIQTDTTTPSVAGDSSTAPSGTTTDPGTSSPPSQPPNTPGGTGPGDTGTTPTGPGGHNPPPDGPGGPSDPGRSGQPSHPNQPPSWRESMRQHFTQDELDEIDTALAKGSNDNVGPGEVPGSGQLTQRERELLARAQHPDVVEIRPDTMMQKIIGPGQEQHYANNVRPGDLTDNPRFDSNMAGSFTSRVVDNPVGQTPGEMIQSNRLDYPGSTFDPNKPMYIMEFRAGDTEFQTPLGAPSVPGDPNLDGDSPDVHAARDNMLDAARSENLPPGSYVNGGWISDYPFSGYGATADGANGVPERIRPFEDVAPGSVIYEVDPVTGQRTPWRVYNGRDNGGWQLPTAS